MGLRDPRGESVLGLQEGLFFSSPVEEASGNREGRQEGKTEGRTSQEL